MEAENLLRTCRGGAVLADTGYDSNELRAFLRKRRTKAVISSKPNRIRKRPLDKALFANRYKVECFFHRLKSFRAVATRYDKSARNFAATIAIACAVIWLN